MSIFDRVVNTVKDVASDAKSKLDSSGITDAVSRGATAVAGAAVSVANKAVDVGSDVVDAVSDKSELLSRIDRKTIVVLSPDTARSAGRSLIVSAMGIDLVTEGSATVSVLPGEDGNTRYVDSASGYKVILDGKTGNVSITLPGAA